MKARQRRAAFTPLQRTNGASRSKTLGTGRVRTAKRSVRALARRAPAAAPDWRPAFQAPLRPGLERDTELMPWLIAESVCGELASFLGEDVPARYAVWIEARAELSYLRNGHFRKLMRGRGNAPRDWLRVYMRHWLAGLLGTERPDLYECLPDTFALGHPLPPPAGPRRRWHGNGEPLHPPCNWDPQRVLRNCRWRWLMKLFPAGSESGRATLQNPVTATDRQVDTRVYDLHGLTAEEVRLVDGAG